MLSTKDVIEKFEVTRATLHNWKSTKPKLYNHIFNSEIQYEKYRETNILLDSYIKTAKSKIFIFEEIDYILTLNLKIENIQHIQDISLHYINTSTKIKKENDTFTLGIYKKLESLNLIEKYIFYDRLVKLKEKLEKKQEKDTDWLRVYFKEFLEE